MSSRTQRGSALIWLLVSVWLAVLAIAGGLVAASELGVFSVPTARLPTHTASPAAATPAPSGTPAPSPTPTDPAPTSAQVDGGSPAPAFEPTYTPASAFPPTPTFVFTPMAFFDGPIVIGTSVAGRPIEVYRFGTGAVHRMIVAGIHGGYEWNTTGLAEELIAYLHEHPDAIPRNVTLFILPTLNPDGYARAFGVAGRVNENGVDLNRNFPVNWASDWDRGPCWNYAPTSSGTGPGSEPETQALIDFVTEHTRVTALISYHSAALGIFPGGEPPHADSVRLAESIASVSSYPYPPVDIGCIYTGTLADWAASEGIVAVDLELHNHFDTDFDENLAILLMFMDWRR